MGSHMANENLIQSLKDKGVVIASPSTIQIGVEVDGDRIAPGVRIHPGTRICGGSTFIMKGAEIGQEGPVTIEDCFIGPGVQLKGGYFRKSLFLDKANMGLAAHVRDACILEEEAGGAHGVGIKQTILMPFVTLGSLINFCDCLMAGGTSRQDHSEVGSSYIHFNFTPNQDKATPSLIGDVPRGVMLTERPVFLGGQGGLVGPAHIGFGAVTGAGIVWRGDLGENRLIGGVPAKEKTSMFYPGIYWEIRNRVIRNIDYIANLIALRQWYIAVRSLFLHQEMQKGALQCLEMALDERIERLKALAKKMPESIQGHIDLKKGEASALLCAQKEEFYRSWGKIEDRLGAKRSYAGNEQERDGFLAHLSPAATGYIATIRALKAEDRQMGTRWLQGIVDEINTEILDILPTFNSGR